jgi:GT2 family glycosyltransferase
VLISVCIPTIRASSVGKAIESVSRQTHRDWELIVVPQGNDQLLLDLLSSYASGDPRIRIVHLPERGKSNALNAAAAVARGDVLALTDDDCEPASDWLETTARVFSTEAEVGCVGGDVVAPRRGPWWTVSTCPAAQVLECRYQPSTLGYRAPPGFYMIGANVAYRRSSIERIGPFDPTLGPGSRYPACEDVDYTIRAELEDIRMATTPKSVVHHSFGRRSGFTALRAHHSAYARGQGALLAKLQMMDHRLGREWAAQRVPVLARARQALTHPGSTIKSAFYEPRVKQAYLEFLAEHDLSETGICVAKGTRRMATGGRV